MVTGFFSLTSLKFFSRKEGNAVQVGEEPPMTYIEVKTVKKPSDKPVGKTYIWEVHAKENPNIFLGEIKWYAKWRKYAFFPVDKCLFEEVCLIEIADFLDEATYRHKNKDRWECSCCPPSE
jgi:hypothetical protein